MGVVKGKIQIVGPNKLFWKLVAWFLLVSLIPTGTITFMTYRAIENRVRGEIIKQFGLLATSRATKLSNYLNTRVANTALLAALPTVKTAMENFTVTDPSHDARDRDVTAVDALDAVMSKFIETNGFDDAYLISADHEIVYCTEQPDQIGQHLDSDRLKDTALAEAVNSCATSLEPAISRFEIYPLTGQPRAFVAAPITQQGVVVGVLAAGLDKERVYSLARDYRGLGKTGEMALGMRFGNEAVFVVPLRFDPDAAFQRRVVLGTPDTAVPMQLAVQDRNGHGITRDYRGKRILGVWRYVPIGGWGMVVKIDTYEAFAPIASLRKRYLTLAGLMAIGVTFLAAVAAQTIASPVEKRISGLGRIVQKAPNEVYIVDATSMRFLWANAGACANTGYPLAQLRRMTLEDLDPQLNDQIHARLQDSTDNRIDERASLEGTHLRKDGTSYPVESHVHMSFYDRQEVMVVNVVDITLRKNAETALRRYSTKLERSNKDLEDFAYVASHDLKSPLRAIDNLAQWVVEDTQDVLPAKSREHLEKMQHRIRRLDGLLDDLLKYSRAGRKHGEMKTVNCRELVDNVIDILSIPEDFSVTVSGQFPRLTTLTTPLETCIRNLIANAIKHHDREAGHIDVRCHENDRLIEFSISDDGPGIPKEYHQRIFEMFQTLERRDDVEGSGMGLAMVKKLVETYGGSIAVDSAVHRGTTFHLRWPKSIRTEGLNDDKK